MGYDSLQKFVRVLEKQGELKRIAEPLSPHLEITEVSGTVAGWQKCAVVTEEGSPATLLINNLPRSVIAQPTRCAT